MNNAARRRSRCNSSMQIVTWVVTTLLESLTRDSNIGI